MFLVSSCSCLCSIHWSHALSREWRCSWKKIKLSVHYRLPYCALSAQFIHSTCHALNKYVIHRLTEYISPLCICKLPTANKHLNPTSTDHINLLVAITNPFSSSKAIKLCRRWSQEWIMQSDMDVGNTTWRNKGIKAGSGGVCCHDARGHMAEGFDVLFAQDRDRSLSRI